MPHQVLSDVVQVALDGTDDHRAPGSHVSLGQVGLETIEARVHGSSRHEDVGKEVVVTAKTLAHHLHGRDQTMGQDGGRRVPGVQGLAYQGGHVLVAPLDEGLADVFELLHGSLLSLMSWG